LLAWRVGLLVGLTVLLYLPYIQHYVAGYVSLEKWSDLRTPGGIYLWIHGILLFPVLTRLLIEVGRAIKWKRAAGFGFEARQPMSVLALWFALLVFALTLLGSLKLLFSSLPVALVAVPVGVLAAFLLSVPKIPPDRRLLWLMIGLAMSISIGVEVFVVKGDIGRQNTVFKFYLQAWMLLSVAAGVSLAWVHQRARRWQQEPRYVWWLGLILLVIGGALFLPFGVRARAIDRISSEVGYTLDGMAFMKHASVHDGPVGGEMREISLYGDHEAIRWMQDNIQGSPVIMEGLGRWEYMWGNRVSIYTGLPTVVGWRWHEMQQRAMLPETMVDQRISDVRECYGTTDARRALDILTRYDVRYIYVGEYEQAYYDPAGLAKFDDMAAEGLLQVVYDACGVRIYKVVS
jgi:YYY domain-containing protein